MSEPNPRIVRRLLLTGVPAFAIAVAAYAHLSGGRYVSTENAYVKADIVRISPKISGTVAEVVATNNAKVNAGDILFRIDHAPYKLALDEANAEVDSARQAIASLRARYRQELLELQRAEARIRFAEVRHKRQKKLRTGGFASTSKLEDAAHELDVARQVASAMRERNAITLSELGGAASLPVEKHARYRRAVAKRDRAALNLENTTVRAPMSGILSNVTIQPGERVGEGNPVFALVRSDRYWLQANLKEVYLTNVRVGQTAKVVLDAYPNFEWTARVDSISPATGAEFSLLPAQNASGNWVKVVQRVPVHLTLDIPATSPSLRVGMTAHVTIDTGPENGSGAIARANSNPSHE